MTSVLPGFPPISGADDVKSERRESARLVWNDQLQRLKESEQNTLRSLPQFRHVKCIIFPDDSVYSFWSAIIVMLLIYTATVTPYMVWFVDESSFEFFIFDSIIDALFFIDILFTCILAFYNQDNELVTSKRQIFQRYLGSWLIIDIFAWLPFEILMDAQRGYNSLIRIARLPRLARLIKMSKLARLAKVVQRKNSFNSNIGNWWHLTPGVKRLMLFVFNFFVIVHLVSCMWGLMGRSNEDQSETWIFKYGFMDESNVDLYLVCLYWTIKTLTTVGYGDITPQNRSERIYACIVMIAGIFIYSYIIGAVANVISSLDTQKKELNRKYEVLNQISGKYNLDPLFYRKIINALDYEAKNRNKGFEDMLENLPHKIKNELLSIIYEKLLEGNKFFQDKSVEFIGSIVPKLKFYRFETDDYIYKKNDAAIEMYFVVKGEVGLAVKTTFGQILCYRIINQGKHFGEIDMFLNPQQIHADFSRALTNCELLAIRQEELIEVLDKFEECFETFLLMTELRQEKYSQESKKIADRGKRKTLVLQKSKHEIDDEDKHFEKMATSKTLDSPKKTINRASTNLSNQISSKRMGDPLQQAQLQDMNVQIEKIRDQQNKMCKKQDQMSTMMKKMFAKVMWEEEKLSKSDEERSRNMKQVYSKVESPDDLKTPRTSQNSFEESTSSRLSLLTEEDFQDL